MMTARAQTPTKAAGPDQARAGLPASSGMFDWVMTALSALYLAGLWVDGWAHYHGRVDGSFFTPWHFLFYSAFAVVAVFLLATHLRNLGKGYAFTRTLPGGYWLSMIGVGVFAVGGVGDMIWHTLFGIEAGTEALMSPSHILLGIGMALIFTGPLRSAWFRFRSQHVPALGWRALGPAMVAATLFTTLLLFFTAYANPMITPYVAMTGLRRDLMQDFGVTSILFTAGVYAAMTALLTWRWRVPFGTFTLLFGVSTALFTVLNDAFALIVPAVVTGAILDLLMLRLRPSPQRVRQFIFAAAASPALYFAGYFVVFATIMPVRWSIHVWTGAIFLAGVIGGLIAVLISASASESRSASET
ncbi:MAG: hypothetical protein L6Q98_16920 [Anaerolineae bacterium]|nr:hypothetical protein [Anaerolineae bacterium]NUQ03879.1 hypothetical protein [Anaerolineae bacterium]